MGEPGSDPLEGHSKYRIVRMLGRGGMGEVFEAEHLHLGTRMVVKLLHTELASKAHQVDRMRIEAQALARLHHPNVVRVTDFDTTASGRPFFVMDYLEGLSLRQELDARGGWLPLPDALEIARQALAGLASAHRLGLVHRDVKLDNLFLCVPPRGSEPGSDRLDGRSVKVLDFGVAKVLAGDGAGPAPLAVPTATGIIVGTPRFLSPEQALGKPIDHRADIYAMGLVLHTLVVGRGPFDDCKTITDMARAHAFTEPVAPSTIAPQPLPAALDAAVLRCLAKRPEDRFQRAEELARELEQIQLTLTGGGASSGTSRRAEQSPHPASIPEPHRSYESAATAPAPTPAPPRWPRSDSPAQSSGIDSTATRVRVQPASRGSTPGSSDNRAATHQAAQLPGPLMETTTDRAPTERIRKPPSTPPQPLAPQHPAQPQPLAPQHRAQPQPLAPQHPAQPQPLAPQHPAPPQPLASQHPAQPQPLAPQHLAQPQPLAPQHPAPPQPLAQQPAPQQPPDHAHRPFSGPAQTIALPPEAAGPGQAGWPGWAAQGPMHPSSPPSTPAMVALGAATTPAADGSAARGRPRWLLPALIVVLAALTGAAVAALLVRLF